MSGELLGLVAGTRLDILQAQTAPAAENDPAASVCGAEAQEPWVTESTEVSFRGLELPTRSLRGRLGIIALWSGQWLQRAAPA